jgi:hypothetical protein
LPLLFHEKVRVLRNPAFLCDGVTKMAAHAGSQGRCIPVERERQVARGETVPGADGHPRAKRIVEARVAGYEARLIAAAPRRIV